MTWDPDSCPRRRPGRGRRAARAAATLGFAVPLAGCGLFSSGVTVTSPSVMTVPARASSSTAPCPSSSPARPGTSPFAAAHLGRRAAGTKSIAIVFDDANAPITPYVYWVVFDIGPGTSALLEGQLPPGARQARGTAGYDRYDPPCPGPTGTATGSPCTRSTPC